MKIKTLLTNFVDVPYFTRQDLLVLGDKFSIPKSSISTLIQRAIKNKEIITLKRNHYITREYFLNNRNKLEFKLFTANVLVKPSYVSRETALQYYGLLSEASINYFTSTTLKLPRKFESTLGIFEYRNIKTDLFNGYKSVKFLVNTKEYSYLIAEPYKAIFDYLYYRLGKRNLTKDQLLLVMDDFRINYHDLEDDQLNKLISTFE